MTLDTGIVAPAGPVSTEELKFTLLKPAAGACTITCVSTVSPRALDRLMEEAVPAASVFPTRTRLDCTQTGNADATGVTPVPVREIIAGEFVALLITLTLPLTLRATVGVNATVSAADWLGAKTVPDVRPLALRPVPVTVTLEIVTFAFPLFVRVAPSELLLPIFTFPKLRIVGLAPSKNVAATPVPLMGIASGEFGALLSSEIEPVTLPGVLGAKTALNVMLFPAAIVAGTVRPEMLKPGPKTLA